LDIEMRYIVSLVFILLLLSGCKKNSGTGDTGSVIFQYEYTNNATVSSHNGWLLDNTGKVSRFQKKATWVFPDKDGSISESDMQKNMAACDSVMAKVSTSDFTNYAGKALSCVDGPMTPITNPTSGAGVYIYAFYQFDSGNKKYKQVILSMYGDQQQLNISAFSSTVVDWMSKIR